MQKTDSFSGITAFVAAAQHGSFTAAADKLGITKSAAGKRISQLPLWMIGDYLADGSLCRVLPSCDGTQTPVHILRPQMPQLPARTRCVTDALLAAARRGAFD